MVAGTTQRLRNILYNDTEFSLSGKGARIYLVHQQSRKDNMVFLTPLWPFQLERNTLIGGRSFGECKQATNQVAALWGLKFVPIVWLTKHSV